MQSAKRPSSTSPPLRRPSKTRDYRSSSSIYIPMYDGLPGYSNESPANRLDSSKEEVMQSHSAMELSFDSLPSRHPSGNDTVSPLDISYPIRNYPSYHNMGFTSTHNSHSPRISSNQDNIGQKSSSTYLESETPYSTETKPLGFKVDEDYTEDFESQRNGKFDKELPLITKVENDPNGGFDFDLDLWSPAFVDSTPNTFHNAPFQQDISAAENTNSNYMTASDAPLPIFGSPLRSHPLDLKYPPTAMDSASSSESTRTCMSSALKILQTLHIPPRTCLWACDKNSIANSRQPRMIDSVLAANKEIVGLVSDMLKCTCSSSSQMQLILTVICGKVMAWYRAMMRTDSNAGDPPTIPSQADMDTHEEDQIERILHQPITVGCYSFGGTLENKIRTQVVFSELQHLETLVETLSSRIQGANFGTTSTCSSGGTWGSDSGSLRQDADTIRRSLSAFLRNQLQAAKGEPTNSIGDEHAHGPDAKQRHNSPSSV